MNSITISYMIIVPKTTCKSKKKEKIPSRETQATIGKKGISIARGARATSKTQEQKWVENNNGD